MNTFLCAPYLCPRPRADFPYPSILLCLYLHSIGAPPPSPASHTTIGSSYRRGTQSWRVAVPIAASILVTIVITVMAVHLVATLRWRLRAKLRPPPSSYRTQPPGAGPATTLALTDVQVRAEVLGGTQVCR